ncbi:hypothetical protein KR215_004817 [Drosophila sulfurigaster]|nr:hypothetical protein KR215_004817 [Drosophila sulfurigaster]
MAQVPLAIVSHKRQVCSLYKRALRNLEAWYDRREVYRYRAVLMRARFDENRRKDLAEGMRLLACGQQELFETKHFQPRNCKLNMLRMMWNLSYIIVYLQLQIAPAAALLNAKSSHQIGCSTTGIRWRRHNIQSTSPSASSERRNM